MQRFHSTKKSELPNKRVGNAEPWFGSYLELGKTEARQSFLHLLNELRDEPKTLAITDRGEKVAVIMGYKQFQTLVASLKRHARSTGKNPLAGLVERVGNLDKSKVQVNALIEESVKKTAESI